MSFTRKKAKIDNKAENYDQSYKWIKCDQHVCSLGLFEKNVFKWQRLKLLFSIVISCNKNAEVAFFSEKFTTISSKDM